MPEYALPPGDPITVHGTRLWSRLDPFEGGIDAQGRPWRVVSYLCLGDEVNEACDHLKGIVAGDDWPKPHKFPLNLNLICQEVSFKLKGPRSKGGNLVKAPFAEIVATYGVSSSDIFGDFPEQTFGGEAIPWTTWQVRGGEEIVPWPAAPTGVEELAYTFHEDSDYVDIDPDVRTLSRRVATKDLIVRRQKIKNYGVFDAILTSLQGKVNAAEWWGLPRGTVLLRPNDYDTDWSPGGGRLGDFTMVFAWREVEHNAFPVPGHFGKFAVVTNPANTVISHEYADFSPLFLLDYF